MMRSLIVFISLFVLSIAVTYGQKITYFGTISNKENRGPLLGVAVTLKSGGTIISRVTTSYDGSYSFQFLPGKTYTIEYSKEGFATKIIKVETDDVLGELLPPGGKIFPPINLDLFKTQPNVDFSFLEKEPVVEWYFDGAGMVYDKGKMKKMKEKIKNTLNSASEQADQNEEKYETLIDEADGLFKDEKYQAALDKYGEALKVPGKETEIYPSEQIMKIVDLMQKQEEEKLEKKQEYESIIAAADQLKESEKFEDAIKKYEEALELLPEEQYPKDQITAIQTTLKGNAEREEKYNEAISNADKLFDNKQYEEAIEEYKEALTYKENEPYPTEQIKKATTALETLASQQEQQEQFNALIKEADELVTQKKYTEAITKYDEALALITDKEVQEKKANATELLAAQKEKATKIAELLASAEQKIEEKDYTGAISDYDKVLQLDETNENATTGKKKANELLNALKNQQEAQARYDQLITEADKLFTDSDYKNAILKYKEALTVKENEAYPTEQIEKANQKIESLKAEQEQNATFRKLVEEAEQEAAVENYEAALQKYNEALEIKEDEEVVKQRDALQLILNQQQQKKKTIDSLLASATTKLAEEELKDALADYNSVIEIDAQNAAAIKGKNKVEQLLAGKEEQAEKQAKFDELVANADKAYNEEKWEEAKEIYIEAKAVFDDNEHVNARIDEIRTLQEKVAQQKEINNQIQTLLDQAEDLKSDNKWNQVVQKYEEALKLDEDREDVQKLLEEAQLKLEEWTKNQSQQEQFDALKQQGETLMAQEKYTEAQSTFEEALQLQDDKEIKEQLELIAEKLKELEAQKEIEAAYAAKMEEGENFAKEEDFKSAITSFEEALEIKKEDPVAQSRIKDMQQKIQLKESNQEKQALYNKAMADGKKAMEDTDYAGAIKFFNDALLAIPLDEEATKLKEEAMEKVANLKDIEEQYLALIDKAEEKYKEAKDNENNKEMLNDAKDLFEESQSIKPNASLPQSKIIEIDKLLREIEEKEQQQNSIAQKEEQYNELLELAAVAATNEQYKDAIDHLNKALEIKPDEEFPKEKIEEYKSLLDELSEQKAIDEKYTAIINKADEAFDNAQYKESITHYKEALEIKEKETYPVNQIAKATEAIKNAKQNSIEEQYQAFIDEADDLFKKEEYEGAISAYENALEVKEKDEYATQQIDESKKKLELQKQQQKNQAQQQKEFDQFIKQADSLFAASKYLNAKDVYEQALGVMPNNVYANDQIELCILKAKEKTKEENEKRYQKLIASADELFNSESYNKAEELYKRAHKLRERDPYPEDQLLKIASIRNSGAMMTVELEDLGEQEDISIMEGAALLSKGAAMREDAKRQAVQERLHLYENQEADRSITDNRERQDFQNEIVAIRDLRGQDFVNVQHQHRVTIDKINTIEYEWDEQISKQNLYEEGDVHHAYKNIIYIDEEMDNTKRQLAADQYVNVEKVRIIQNDKLKQTNAEIAKFNSKINNAEEQLLDVKIKTEAAAAINEQKEIDRQIAVRDIKQGLERQTHEEKSDFYSKVIDIQDAAVLARIKQEESTSEKIAIQKQMQDDLKVLAAMLQRKEIEQNQEVYENQLEVNSQLAELQNEINIKNSEQLQEHKNVIKEVRNIKEEYTEQLANRSEKYYSNVYENTDEINDITNLQKEQSIENKKNHDQSVTVIRKQARELNEGNSVRVQAEADDHYNAANHLSNIQSSYEIAKSEKGKDQGENYESVKGVEASINSQQQLKTMMLKDENIATQQYINKMEHDSVPTPANVPNTLGLEYPEGVSQENYVRRDNDGIPVKIITRRIVVKDGHGDVYIRIQTRNGITYSKNGMSIAQSLWINGTQDAKLEKHY